LQPVEGLNSASFGFGQAGSRFVTLSFWHKHTKTGVHCVSIRNSATDRSYVAEYTQDVTDTWEYASVTIPVDNSGTWLYDNGVGMFVTFALAAGTNFQALSANAWQAGNALVTTSQVNNLDSTANNFKIALVQLEAGSFATAFETRSIGQERQLCQRYYQENVSSASYARFSANVTSAATYQTAFIPFPTTMRATPTVTLTNQAATSFPATSGTATADALGFLEARIANVSAAGQFSSSWTASAEI
jgi:hypothetical protein